jgi:hypothetical protein
MSSQFWDRALIPNQCMIMDKAHILGDSVFSSLKQLEKYMSRTLICGFNENIPD